MPEDNTQPDHVQAFAEGLRALKLDAGDPTLVSLADQTGISKTVLSNAFSGKRLPTEKTVAAIASALGGDRAEWMRRRNELALRLAVAEEAEDVPEQRPDAVPTRKHVSLRAAIAMSAVTALVVAGATSAVWAMLPQETAASAAASTAGEQNQAASSDDGPFIDFADGVDPMQTVCRTDSVIAASEERLDGDVLVQIMYSNKCMAVWGRVTRYDTAASGNSLSMRVYPANDPQSDRSQERSASDVQSLYTTLVIEPDVEARICGVATITRGDEKIELGPPMCV